MYKASVIVPTYKPRAYIYECLDSIFTQTFPASDLELIIVLNGCCEPYKDKLVKYIEEKAPVKENVHLIQTDAPGVSNARNMALDKACGEYILFVDDDDIISPEYVGGMVNSSSEDTVVAARLRLFDDVTGEEFHTNLTKAYDIAREEISNRPLTLFSGRRLLSAVGGKSLPMQLIGRNRFDTTLSLGEDSVFITQLTKRIKHIVLAPEDAVYSVRKRDNSASRAKLSTREQIGMALSLAWIYFRMYLADIKHNDFKFYASRIVASLLKAFIKRYRTV